MDLLDYKYLTMRLSSSICQVIQLYYKDLSSPSWVFQLLEHDPFNQFESLSKYVNWFYVTNSGDPAFCQGVLYCQIFPSGSQGLLKHGKPRVELWLQSRSYQKWPWCRGRISRVKVRVKSLVFFLKIFILYCSSEPEF